MKLFTADSRGNLTPHAGKRIVAEFEDGRMLELTGRPLSVPVPDGLHIRGSRRARAAAGRGFLRLNIISVAGNGIAVAPCSEKADGAAGVRLFISGDDGCLKAVKGGGVVAELSNGKMLEIQEDYAKSGLLVWGGRAPLPALSPEDLRDRAENLGIYPVCSNIIHVFPYELM